MYGMTNYENLSDDELTQWLVKEGFIQSQCKKSIYYKYVPDRTNFFFISYLDYCVYWYTSEALGKWFLDPQVNRFHVKFLGYSHWFMSIRISHVKDHNSFVHQARFATSIVAK